jgi:hypothetical protein
MDGRVDELAESVSVSGWALRGSTDEMNLVRFPDGRTRLSGSLNLVQKLCRGFEQYGSIRMYLNPSRRCGSSDVTLYPHLGFILGWCGTLVVQLPYEALRLYG